MAGIAGQAFTVEDFLQSLTAQLDRAQDLLAMKVRGLQRPLTWALKDLDLELRVFVEVDPEGRVCMRNAGPNENGASTVHLSLTTITRPMVEENTIDLRDDVDPRSIDELRRTSQIDADDQRRLQWMGVRTIGQLRQFSDVADPRSVHAVTDIPVDRLRAALQASARPTVTGHEFVRQRSGETLLRIQGANLVAGGAPAVRLAGEAVEVVEAAPHGLLVRPLSRHVEGELEVQVGDERATGWFRRPGNGAGVPNAGAANGGAQNGGAQSGGAQNGGAQNIGVGQGAPVAVAERTEVSS